MYANFLWVALLAALTYAIPARNDPGEHIQHVTFPPVSTTPPSNSHIQRVPAKISSKSEESSRTKTKPFQQTLEGGDQTSTSYMEETTISEILGEINTEVSSGSEETTVVPQSRDDLTMPVDDLVTANFWWGLGPVYPHLYQFKRVPHLVPIHSWNPYHDYYTYHQKYPGRYSF